MSSFGHPARSAVYDEADSHWHDVTNTAAFPIVIFKISFIFLRTAWRMMDGIG
jgi:hypothetical protein